MSECELIFGVSGGNLSASHVVVVVVAAAAVARALSLPATYPDYGSRAGTKSAVHELGASTTTVESDEGPFHCRCRRWS